MKFWNIDATTMAIIIMFVLALMATSCSTSKYYKACDGKKKFKSEMSFR